MGLIETAWLDYAAKVIPPGAPRVQVTESRRAFYAGARALLAGMVEVLGTEDKEPTQADMATMDAIQAELDQFLKDIGDGKA